MLHRFGYVAIVQLVRMRWSWIVSREDDPEMRELNAGDVDRAWWALNSGRAALQSSLITELLLTDDALRVRQIEAYLSRSREFFVDRYIEESCIGNAVAREFQGHRGTAEERLAVVRFGYATDHGELDMPKQ